MTVRPNLDAKFTNGATEAMDIRETTRMIELNDDRNDNRNLPQPVILKLAWDLQEAPK
jgi:hypothetical protein